VTSRQSAFCCFARADAASFARSSGLRMPVSLPPLRCWNALTAAIALSPKSLSTSPV